MVPRSTRGDEAVTTARRILSVVCGVAVLSCILACGGVRQAAAKAKRANDMAQVGMAYHSFWASNPKGPADANEFATFVQKMDPSMAGLAGQIRSNQIVLYYGVKMPGDFPKGANNTVLGYESKVPSSGGWVIMGDGSVKEMTAAEFGNAPKPSKGGDKK
jgi:hypothetical protein